ncbi:MAG: hypothetical protein HY698_09845 [Deltaproteobacteria bacterium]|nr:hypothetical protein [Deltaproteobacteria bacterium]
MGWLDATEGFDLDDDGAVDNLLGLLSSIANPHYERTVRNGDRIEILDIDLGSWPAEMNDDEVALEAAFFRAVDADEPPDPTNNYDGAGRFLAVQEQFDVNCRPTSKFDEARVRGRRVEMKTDRLPFVVGWRGTAEFRRLQFEGEFDDTRTRLQAKVGAAWTSCSLSTLPSPMNQEVSSLDGLVGLEILPDIDMDGDGLETMVMENQRVIACIDGDGSRIDGKNCACDPRIADGYSIAYFMELVPAQVLGIADWR